MLSANYGLWLATRLKILYVSDMPDTIELDVRGLEPPEPLMQVLSTWRRSSRGQALLLKIDCRPPLYRILDRDGYAYDERPGKESLFEIAIRPRVGS